MKNRKIGFDLILLCVAAAEIALSMYFTYRYGAANIDSDNSSEMVLSRLLADEGAFISKNWFYSTELRVLNTQLILSLLFRFTNNWRLVRTIGSGILMAVMACTYIYMVNQAGLGRKGRASVCLLLVPFCSCYQQFVLFGLYYIPHVSISFAAVGLMLGFCNSDNKIYRAITAVLSVLLALAAGLGGIRMLVVLYAPLVITMALHAVMQYRADRTIDYRTMSMTLLTALTAGAGFVINSVVLSDIYTFKSFSGTEFSNPDIFARSDKIINGLISFFGYKEGRRVMGTGIAANVTALFLFVFVIYMLIKLIRNLHVYSRNEQIIIIFFAAAFILNMFTFYFADMWEENGNYLIPFMIWIIPLIAIYFNHENMRIKLTGIMAAMVVCAFAINSATEYYEWKNTDINAGKEGIIRHLIDNGYRRGYADFWDANVFTELSGGQLEICNIRAFDESFAPLEWLMDKSYAEWDEPDKVFIIVDNTFSWENRDRLSYLNRDNIIVLNSRYCVFAFENDAELVRVVQEGMHKE